MIVTVPQSDHAYTRLTSTAGDWSHRIHLGPVHRQYDIPLPEGIDVSDLEVLAEFCNQEGKAVEPPIVVRARAKKTTVAAVVAPAPETKVEPKPRSKPRTRRTREVVQEQSQVEQSVEQPVEDDPANLESA